MFSMRKFLIVLALLFLVSSCSTVSEINERVKGDGVPYIPGI